MMVLGSMLTNVNALNVASDSLDGSDFYYTEHQLIFDTLKDAYKKDKPADIHLVAEELKRKKKLNDIGGISYLTTLAQYAGTSAYVEEYAQLVKDKAILRRMITAAQVIEKKALEEEDEVSKTLDDAQSLFFQISQSANRESGLLIAELLSGVKAESQLPFLKELQDRQEKFQELGEGEELFPGEPTHFNDLDHMLGGLGKSNFLILAARPAMGKTVLALNIAENVCFKNKVPVAIFSLEMSAEQLLHRMISSQSEVEAEKIKRGSLSGSEYQRVVSVVNEMQKHTIIIDDQPGLKITDLRARARRMKETHDIGLIVIDYLQLLSGSGNRSSSESRQLEISEISRMLKNLARELDVPVLCLSQLSRKVEERAGHRPMMSDLRESGCLTGDTEIMDAETGKIHTIKELAERKKQTPIQVHAVDEKLKVGKFPLIKAFYSGEKQVFELQMRSGKKIKASANHPFLKLGGWTALEDLKVGDHLALPRKVSIDKPSNPMSADEVTLLAHLLGDGCVLPNQPYHYTSADLQNISIVEKTASSLFNLTPRRVKQKNWWHCYLPSPYQLTHGRYHPITNWYNKMDIGRKRSYEKEIPKALFECEEHLIQLFLKHLWATDGNISLKKMNGKSTSGNIYYSSSSEQLSHQVQGLLAVSGIRSHISIHRPEKYRPMYSVKIQGKEDQLLFLDKIGCHGERGDIIPELIEKLNKIQANPNADVIPKEAWKTYIDSARKRKNLTWRDFAKELGMSYCGSALFKSSISRTRLKKINMFLKDEKIELIANSDVNWEKIVSITPLGVEPVYDATVKKAHNFLANGIFAHNSLEQDSDVVMFLMRPEYYDPYNKPGLAELMIGKNRHGKTGDVKLTFRKEIVQFANYTEPGDSPTGEQSAAFNAFSPN